MQCKLIRELKYGPSAGPELDGTIAAIGTIIDTPTAYLLVANGDAVPECDECAVASYNKIFTAEETGPLTDEQLQQLQQQVEIRVGRQTPFSAGIHPDDVDSFNRGEMTGYDPNTGEPIPGENAEYDGPLELP